MDNFTFEPRFHVGIYMPHFRHFINPAWASSKVATKTFYVVWGPFNTFRVLVHFLHEIPTGLYFMTFAAGLKRSATSLTRISRACYSALLDAAWRSFWFPALFTAYMFSRAWHKWLDFPPFPASFEWKAWRFSQPDVHVYEWEEILASARFFLFGTVVKHD